MDSGPTPQSPVGTAIANVLRSTPLHKFYNLYKSHQTAYHDLCTSKKPPDDTGQLLWNGLKFCVEKPIPKPNVRDTCQRLKRDIRLKYFWSKLGVRDSGSFCSKLYKPSGFTPPKANPTIEKALADFQKEISKAVTENLLGLPRKHNIPTGPRKLLSTLPENKDFIVLPADKGLGPVIMERPFYKQKALDHLQDNKTYKRLSKRSAERRMHAAEYQFKLLIQANKKVLTEDEWTYFQRCFTETRRTPQGYWMPKVHKNPTEYRPIISGVNSRMGDLSKWVDYQLQQVVRLCPCYLKDSNALLRKLRKLGKLPPNTVAVTADAVAMYTNIDTKHSLQVLQRWFELHAHQLPHRFPVQMILKAINLIMCNNVFQFDDTYWLQLIGTAMGTSCACMIATIYFSYHEETRILPVYAHQYVVPLMSMPPIAEPRPTFKTPPLLMHARLIDDALQIWDMSRLPKHYRKNFRALMSEELKFGILRWKVDKLTKKVDFLDLTIAMDRKGEICTKTFVKRMNLHLYIPPASAHPIGTLKSLIFGNLQRYWIQNSKLEDFVSITKAFHGHLLNRGYSPVVLAGIFREAAASLNKKFNRTPARDEQLWDEDHPTTAPRSGTFIHWEYHPRDIGRRAIRQIFESTLAPALAESQVLAGQLTIAFSTPQSLGNCLTKTQLTEPPGYEVSRLAEPME